MAWLIVACGDCRAEFSYRGSDCAADCPLCAGALQRIDRCEALRPAATLPVRQVREVFLQAVHEVMDGSTDLDDRTSAQPPALLWLPFRRFRGMFIGQSPPAVVTGEPHGVLTEAEWLIAVCSAGGIDDALLVEFQSLARGFEFSVDPGEPDVSGWVVEEVPLGMIRRRGEKALRQSASEIPSLTAMDGLEARLDDAADATALWLLPVWVHSFRVDGQRWMVMMDAVSGHVVARLPRPRASSRPLLNELRRFAEQVAEKSEAALLRHRADRQVPHWSWLPAIACLLLSRHVTDRSLSLVLISIGVVSLLVGYLGVGWVRRSQLKLLQILRAERSITQRARLQKRLSRCVGLRAQVPSVYVALMAAAALCVVIGTKPTPVAEHSVVALGLNAEHDRDAAMRSRVVPMERAASATPSRTYAQSLDPPPLTRHTGILPMSDGDRKLTHDNRPSHTSGRSLRVGVGAYHTLAAAVADAKAGDTIVLDEGEHNEPSEPIIIDRDLTISGRPGAKLVWNSGAGPFIRVGGTETHLTLEHVHLVGNNIYTALLGDANLELAESTTGVRPDVHLKDVWMYATAASAIYSHTPGARFLIEGGAYVASGTPIIVRNVASLTIRGYNGHSTRIQTDDSTDVLRSNLEPAVNNGHGLLVENLGTLSVSEVTWLGNPAGNVAIGGDVLRGELDAASSGSLVRHVELVDERRDVITDLTPAFLEGAVRFRVQNGRFEPIAAGR